VLQCKLHEVMLRRFVDLLLIQRQLRECSRMYLRVSDEFVSCESYLVQTRLIESKTTSPRLSKSVSGLTGQYCNWSLSRLTRTGQAGQQLHVYSVQYDTRLYASASNISLLLISILIFISLVVCCC